MSTAMNVPQTEPRPEHQEGPIARAIEQQTAKIPSDTFLWAAVGAMVTSLTLELAGKKQTANFIGQWAPTLLILGLYNKLVKLEGSDGAAGNMHRGSTRRGNQGRGGGQNRGNSGGNNNQGDRED